MEKYSSGKKAVVMTREQVRSFDSYAINQLGIPGVVLMENAGRGCVELIKKKLAAVASPKVCIFCGTGNNGGDGYVIGRHLLNAGFGVTVVLCGSDDKVKGDAKINLDILRNMGQAIEQLDLNSLESFACATEFAAASDIIVDSIFGTGLKGQLKGEYVKLIDMINSQKAPILAVDIPSGLDCDSGRPLGAAIRADHTVTFVAVKKGFTSAENTAEYTGEIFVASIGVDANRI